MKRLTAVVVAALATGGWARAASAQDSTAIQLGLARQLYERLETERALALLRRLVSPQWNHPQTAAQRAEAYKYLGAALVLVGRTDSGVVAFRAALERDPFTDLDPEAFTPTQAGAFARARRQAFAVGLRPVTAGRVDPRSERVRFSFATTHSAGLRAQLRRGSDSAFTILETSAEGSVEIVWDGLGGDGRLSPPGRYELRVVARSRVMQASDSARLFFDLRHDVAALDDTLPDIPPGTFLPERTPPRAAWGEIGKGVLLAGGVFLAATALTDNDLGDVPLGAPAVVAGTAVIAGIAGFTERRRSSELPDNVAANQRRRDERNRTNEQIRARNAEKVARTVLVISPAAGVGP